MKVKLKRYTKNPILSPLYWWERKGVFNPAVIQHNSRILMLYRAQGEDGISRFGLAKSIDGKKFERVSKFPILEADLNDEFSRIGIEDPRISKIDDTYFITYTSASVYPVTKESLDNSLSSQIPWRIRVGLITTKDWVNFKRHGIILKNIDTKNACFFPQKFYNKFALIHRVHHHIHISFSKNFTNFNKGEVLMLPDNQDWQEQKIGICSSPISFYGNWLSTFHGVDKIKKYSIGFVYFDRKNPKNILYRSNEPILSPQEPYEKHGFVNNVVFATGLMEKGDNLMVYYGAADYVICLAEIDSGELKKEIIKEVE